MRTRTVGGTTQIVTPTTTQLELIKAQITATPAYTSLDAAAITMALNAPTQVPSPCLAMVPPPNNQVSVGALKTALYSIWLPLVPQADAAAIAIQISTYAALFLQGVENVSLTDVMLTQTLQAIVATGAYPNLAAILATLDVPNSWSPQTHEGPSWTQLALGTNQPGTAYVSVELDASDVVAAQALTQ